MTTSTLIPVFNVFVLSDGVFAQPPISLCLMVFKNAYNRLCGTASKGICSPFYGGDRLSLSILNTSPFVQNAQMCIGALGVFFLRTHAKWTRVASFSRFSARPHTKSRIAESGLCEGGEGAADAGETTASATSASEGGAKKPRTRSKSAAK